MTKITFHKTHKIIAAVMALVLCFSAFLWIAPQVQAEELDISGANVTGFALTGDSSKIADGELTGGSIGVFVTSSSDRYKGSNIEWCYNEVNKSWERAADSKMVLFKDNGDDQKIAAYYPYTSTLTDGKAQIELPEAYDAEYEKYDYLYGEYAALNTIPATIALNHLMSKVVVTVDSTMGAEIDSGDKVESIALRNVPRTADWTVPTADLSNFGSDGNIGLYYESYGYIGYALPTGAETLTLRITMTSGRVFTATASLDDATTTDKTEVLESGVLYNLGVKVGKDKVEISTITVTDWKNGGTIDGGVATVEETLKNCNMGNHIGTLVFTSTNGTHYGTYSCCGKVTETVSCSGGTATCLGSQCAVCGAWYGTKDADNHAKELTYTPNDDGATHTKAYPCCDTVVAEEAHTMDATTGKCVCGLQMAVVSITRGNTVTYYPYVSNILGEDASVLQSGDTVRLLQDVNFNPNGYGYPTIPEGVTFDGGNFTLYFDYELQNYGTITGGTFNSNVSNDGTITGGTFNGSVDNSDGTITGGTFNGSVDNSGTITGGNFDSVTILDADSSISGNLTITDSLRFTDRFYPSEGNGIIDLSNATLGGGNHGADAIELDSRSLSEEWNWNNEDENVVKLKLPEGYCVLVEDYETGEYVYTETLNSETRDCYIRKHSHEFDTTTGACECGAKL